MYFAAAYVPIAREDNFIGHLECGLFSLGTLPITLHLLHQHILSILSEHYFYNLAIDVNQLLPKDAITVLLPSAYMGH